MLMKTTLAPILAASLSLAPGLRGHSGNPRGLHFDAPGDEGGGAGGSGATGSTGAQGGKESQSEEELRFTQKQLDEVIGRRLDQERRKWERDFNVRLEDEVGKRLKAKEDEAAKGGKGKDEKGEQMVPKSEFESQRAQLEQVFREQITQVEQGYKDQLTEKDKRISELLAEKCNAAIMAAVAPLSPVNAHQVAKLVADQVGFDDDGAIVVFQPDGKSPRYGRDGNYLKVEDFMAEFAKGNPHLFKAEVTTGGGSRGGAAPSSSKQNLTTSTAKIAAGLARMRTQNG